MAGELNKKARIIATTGMKTMGAGSSMRGTSAGPDSSDATSSTVHPVGCLSKQSIAWLLAKAARRFLFMEEQKKGMEV
jgi:hypothetical protein